MHGLFEQPEILASLLGVGHPDSLERTFDQLADTVEEHLDLDSLLQRAAATL